MKMRGRKIPKPDAAPLCGAMLIVLSSFLTLTGHLRSFAPAAMAAALAAGLNPLYLVVGAAAALRPALWAACAVCLAVDRLLKRIKGESRSVAVAMAGAAAGAALEGAEPSAIAAATLLAGALAPALVAGLKLKARRKALSPDEKISLAAACALALAGLSRAHPAGVLAAQALAAYLTAAAAREGAASGALTGLLSGAAALSGPEFGLWLGLGGAAAGGLKGLPKWAAGLGCLAALAVGGAGLAAILAAAMGVVAYCAGRPPRLLSAFARLHQDQSAQRRLRHARRRLRAMGRALDECAQACLQAPEAAGGESLAAVMRERLCEGCADYARCWAGQSPQAGRLFSYLSAQLDADGDGRVETAPDQVRFCRRAPAIPRRLAGVFAAARQRQSAQRERAMAAQLSAGPLEQAARLLGELDRQLARGESEDALAAQTAEAAVDRMGGQARISATALALEAEWTGEQVRRAADVFSQALGGRYVAQGAGRYAQAPALKIDSAACCRASVAGAPCGDQALCAPLGDGRTALILSDGMGRGEDAARESRRVVTLLHRLLLAGAQPRSAIDAVNSMMRLRGGDGFATLDLCVLDAYRGEAEFYKLGACLSALVRRGVCLRVEGGQLPPGVVERAEPNCVKLRLRAGDTVVMVSDGIADFAREGQEDWLTTQLAAFSGLSAHALSHALVAAAAKRDQNAPRDDMTALCARAEKGE